MPDQQTEAQLSHEKSIREMLVRHEKKQREHREMIASGKAIDLKEAHKRCFEGDNSGTVKLKGW